jgi:hypothetical protein
MNVFRIGTGGVMGVYYPIGRLIAQGITDQNQIGVGQTSGGSIANVHALLNGEIEAGLVQADVAFWAFHTQGPFQEHPESGAIRAVASLYAEHLQIVIRADAGIHAISDLRGKHLSLDEEGSGTLAVMRIVLDAYGLSERDLSAVYLKPEFTTNRLAAGDLDGFCVMAGVPMHGVQAVEEMGIFLLPVERPVALQIQEEYPWFMPAVIEEGVYSGVRQTSTIGVYALLLVHEDVDEEQVYELSEKLWSPEMQSLLHAGHPCGSSITLDTALEGIPIPLHPGAERYYRERGILSEEAGSM